jgi:hypothetical protein
MRHSVTLQMNYCRVLRKGSGVVFGQSVFHVVRRGPKTTPDPVRAAYHQTKSDSYCYAGPYSLPCCWFCLPPRLSLLPIPSPM